MHTLKCPDLDEVLVLLRVPLQAESPEQILLAALEELIEDVEVSFSVALVHDTRFLQQVVKDVTPNGSTLPTGKANGNNGGTLTLTCTYTQHKHTCTRAYTRAYRCTTPPKRCRRKVIQMHKGMNVNASDTMVFKRYSTWVTNSSRATTPITNEHTLGDKYYLKVKLDVHVFPEAA